MNKQLLLIVAALAAAYYIFTKKGSSSAITPAVSGLKQSGVPKVAQSTNTLRSNPVSSGIPASNTDTALKLASGVASAISSIFGGKSSGGGGGFGGSSGSGRTASGNSSATSQPTRTDPTSVSNGIVYNPGNDTVTSSDIGGNNIYDGSNTDTISANENAGLPPGDTSSIDAFYESGGFDTGGFDATSGSGLDGNGGDVGTTDFENFLFDN